jgi:hypothetical protein
MALSADVKIYRYGTPGNSTQPTNIGITANATVYRGSIAATRSGYLVAMSSPQSTDIVWGLIGEAGPGTINGSPGIAGGTTNGAVTAEVETGTFFLASGTGSDAIAQANIGATCYVMNETTVGLTNGSNTRPVAGQVMAIGANVGGTVPYSGLVAVKLGSNAGSTGGPS